MAMIAARDRDRGARGRILFVAPNSYVTRNWISSGLADLVREQLGLDPIFASHFNDRAFTSLSGQAYQNHCVPHEARGATESPIGFCGWYLLLAYLRLRLAAQERPYGGGQLLEFSRKRDPVSYLVRGIRVLFPRTSRRRRWMRHLLERINPNVRHYVELIQTVAPVAVVVGTPGILPLDQLMTIAARAANIPVHCVVNSWDNLVSRGPMIRRPDTLMVWNRFMLDQAVRIHDFPSANVRVVGSLQFSRYADPVTKEEISTLRRRVGLAAGDRYLLYLTSAEVPEYEAEDVAELVRLLDDSEFRSVPLVVRVHPQTDPRAFTAVTDGRVLFDRSPAFANQGAGGMVFDAQEMRSMAALLTGAMVVFASAGTTALLEAAIFDRPMMQLRWMDALPRRFPGQAAKVRDYQKYLHIRDLDSTGSRGFSDSPARFLEDLRKLQSEAATFAARRREAVERLVTTPVDGAPQRVVEKLREALASPPHAQARTQRRRADGRPAGSPHPVVS